MPLDLAPRPPNLTQQRPTLARSAQGGNQRARGTRDGLNPEKTPAPLLAPIFGKIQQLLTNHQHLYSPQGIYLSQP